MSLVEMVYKGTVRPIIFSRTKNDPELAHEWAIGQLIKLQNSPGRSWLAQKMLVYSHPMLQTQVFGVNFSTPLGLAAGFDKHSQVYWKAIPLCGWSFCEIGGITIQAQTGNPKVRILRSKQLGSLWNHMGFNNPGAKDTAKIMGINPESTTPVGLNIGKGKNTSIEDTPHEYAEIVRTLWQFVDFIDLNLSSPNTPGLRDTQNVGNLKKIIEATQQINRLQAQQKNQKPKPLGIKLSPDIRKKELMNILDTCLQYCVDFVVLVNTSTRRDICPSWAVPANKGGISGQVIKSLALEITKAAYCHIKMRQAQNPKLKKLAIIGAGGIHDADSLYARIRAGASLCQIYTAWPFEGPDLAKRCCKGLVQLLKKDGYSHISEAVGVDA